MITIEQLEEKYKGIVFWGAVESVVAGYIQEFKSSRCYIVDQDKKKWGTKIAGVEVLDPEKIKKSNLSQFAIIISSQRVELEVYNLVRRSGFRCDVFCEDMIYHEPYVNGTGCFWDKNDLFFGEGCYSAEKNIQVLIFLLKVYGIKRIIVSPGTTNMAFVASIQKDPFFKLYSCMDERSAAYMACGMADETGEPIVLSCTGATSSRNYMPGLTEAFYRKLPILAVTSSQASYKIGNDISQVTDRVHLPTDIARMSVQLDEVHTYEEKKYCELFVNRALSELQHRGGGPVHINLITSFSKDFTVKTLPECKVIHRVSCKEEMPAIQKGRTAIIVASHRRWSNKLTLAVDKFCELTDAVVLCDHISNYTGKYKVQAPLFFGQSGHQEIFDLIICIGEISVTLNFCAKQVWRIDCDGIIKDPYLNLNYLFEMKEEEFFQHYIDILDTQANEENKKSFRLWEERYERLIKSIPELPFSNYWIAQCTAKIMPRNSVVYFGIIQSLRSWSLFEMDRSIRCYACVGGFGIDGTLSTILGASLVRPESLYFCIVGDLAFFYDINALGNRHVGKNLRILLVNNDGGNEQLYKNGLCLEKQEVNYIAAYGHNGHKGLSPVKGYVESMGYTYLCANSKEEYLGNLARFLSCEMDASIVFEVFTEHENELQAREMISSLS